MKARGLAVIVCVLWGDAARAAADAVPLVQSVDTVGFTVSDMEREVAFLTGVLGFSRVDDREVLGDAYEHAEGVFGLRMRVVRLRLGAETLELTEYLASRGRAIPEDSRANDRWFQHVAIVVSDIDRAYRLLREHGVESASTGPQTLPAWNKAAGGIQAFYFKDPDHHFLEIIHFPAGKGDPRWQEAKGQLFLGIDHTAIVVESTEQSLRFYRDGLGLKVAGESENYGTEQEHLNNVFGARLRITSLRAAAGPGIELLEYLAPQGGRPAPLDGRSNDLWHWQTRLRVKTAAGAVQGLSALRAGLVSPGVVELPAAELGAHRVVLAQDRDAHGLLLSEP
jgi:catechol 2,3-dioxygenase-like lactoylglutathione lyase family enzyme